MLSVVAAYRLVERLVVLALDLRVVLLALCRSCEENADGREQRKKEEVTMVSIDTCLPLNYSHGDEHRCQLRFVVSSQALMLGSCPNFSNNPLQQTRTLRHTQKDKEER